ncbi:ATP-binding protein, partial [Methylobacterium hispanicum]
MASPDSAAAAPPADPLTRTARAEFESIRSGRLLPTWKLFAGFAGLVIGLAWTWVGYVSTRDYTRSIENAQKSADNLSLAFAQQVALRVELVDRILQEVASRLREDPRIDLGAWSLANPAAMERIGDIVVVDASGETARSVAGQGPRRPTPEELELLRATTTRDARELVVNRRSVDRATGRDIVRIARPVGGQGNQDRGIVVTAVDADTFLGHGSRIDVGIKGVVSISTADGSLAARLPSPRLSQNLPAETWLASRRTLPAAAGRCAIGRSSLDGIPRIVCVHEVPNAPLVATVGLAMDETSADYAAARRNYYVWAFFFSLGAAAFPLNFFFREKKMERFARALADSEGHLREQGMALTTTLDSVAEGIALFGPDDRLKLLNRRGYELLAIPRIAETEQWPLTRILEWQIEQGHFEEFPPGTPVQHLIDEQYGGLGLKHSLPVLTRQRADGCVLEIRTYPSKDGGTTRTFTDVTERERTARALEAAKEAAEAGNRAKTEFVATMSHEIRTPLNGVLGMANLLSDSHLDDRQRHYVGTIRRCGDALLSIVDDVLDFSKLEAGRVDLEHIPFETGEVARSVADILEVKAAEKGLSVMYAEGDGFPERSCGDPNRLRQVLWNLVGNAIKFTDEGWISIEASLVQGPHGPRLRYSVSDTGIGIPEEARHRLFRQFEQTDPSVSRRFGGTGLGLAIVRRIVEAFGGEIGVVSQPGEGSTFWFEIPHVEPSACDPTAVRDEDVLPAGRRILVVEDNGINQEVAHALLTKLGHDVVLASGGAEAIERVREGRFDLVLMDLNMPLMDGYETARAIRQIAGENLAVPIIATTADASLRARERCLSAGMQGFVSKPFDIARLKAALSGEATSAVRPQTRADGPLVDETRVSELLDQLGPQILVRLAEEFVVEAEALPTEMRGGGEAMTRSVHNLRGSAANLGLLRIVALCDVLRASAEAGDDTAEVLAAMLAAALQSAEVLK